MTTSDRPKSSKKSTRSALDPDELTPTPVTKRGLLPEGRRIQKVERERDAYSVDRFIPGRTGCRFCNSTLRVNHTETAPADNGGVLITRSVKCNGPRRHVYKLIELHPPIQRKE